MLIKGDKEGGEGKPSEQARLFATEPCGGDFRQRSVQIGSRGVKRARLLSEPVKRAQVEVLEESYGGVSNGVRSRRFRSEQNGVHASKHKPVIREDANHGDDSSSVSEDAGLFVVQVRSPTSKQLLHGRRQGSDQVEFHRDIAQPHDSPHALVRDNGSVHGSHQLLSDLIKDAAPTDVAGHGLVSSDMEKVVEEVSGREEGALHVYVRKRKRSAPAGDAVPLQAHGSSQSVEPSGERVMKHYVRRPHRLAGADMTGKPSVTSFSSFEGREAEERLDASERVESLNVFQRRSKMNHSAERPDDVSTVKGDGERKRQLNDFQRRSKLKKLPQPEPHLDVSTKVETEANLQVFRRRSKMNHENDGAGASISKTDVESEVKLHVFQRRSKMSLTDGEREEKVAVFRRRSKMTKVPEAGVHRVEAEVKVNVFQRRSKIKELRGNDVDSVQKGVSEKQTPAGYARAEHQPAWLPAGWTLEVRQGKATTKPKDKYYHHDKTGRIFRSKNDVLQFSVDRRVGGSQVMCDGSGMKRSSQHQKRPSLADGGAPKSPQLLRSGDGVPLSTGSPVSTLKSSGDSESRGKLIFRLKRKQSDSGGGKGRSKRPMYEVVHGEKASSSTSTPTKPTTGEDALPTSDPPRVSSRAESVDPHVIEKPIAAEIPSLVGASSFKVPRVAELEQAPHTVLGIPATARHSGMANHTHAFPDTTHPLSLATSAPLPTSEPGGDRDSAGPSAHKPPSKTLTKADHTKLFLDLGRRLCLSGIEQKTKEP